MRILITGANGQLGSEVADSFARQHQIFALVRELPKRASENVRYLQHDLTRSPETLISKIEALDAIIHIAQSRHYKDFPDQADDIFNVNVKSTQDLLSLGKLLKIKYFLYTSTGSVYEPFDNNLSEECPVKPLTFYSTSKYISEKIISCYSSCFDVCIFRLFFLYGRPSASSLISALVKRIRLRESITIEGTDGLV
jgi:nucleoside-diphosphate-sugar epimerase